MTYFTISRKGEGFFYRVYCDRTLDDLSEALAAIRETFGNEGLRISFRTFNEWEILEEGEISGFKFERVDSSIGPNFYLNKSESIENFIERILNNDTKYKENEQGSLVENLNLSLDTTEYL